MGGIAGYLGSEQAPDVLRGMAEKLSHRGPDGSGEHVSAPVFMGVRWAGDSAQPVVGDDGQTAIVFDGEIYNSRKERQKLTEKGHVFKTRSSAEVILRLYQEYGVGCVSRLRGSFVFAIHDKAANLVFMARDRMGVKPLYYATTPAGDLVFASEIKALFAHPAMSAVPNLVGIDAFLTLRYSPGPESMFRGVHRLPAGHRLIWNPGLHVMVEQYWSWENYQVPDPALISDADFQQRFDALFEESVGLRIEGDSLPGVLLSGGLNSAAVAAAMTKLSGGPVRTFSVGFEESSGALQEARNIAQILGSEHQEIICSPADMARLPDLIRSLDEPIGDPLILPMSLVTGLARKNVRAVLSGDGADELLCGHYMHGALLRARNLPRVAYDVLRPVVEFIPPFLLNMMFDYPGKMGARSKRKLVDFIAEMKRGSLRNQYMFLHSLFDSVDKKHVYGHDMQRVMGTFQSLQEAESQWPTAMSTMLALQQEHWLPDSVLTRLDKISAASALEVRMPFMDHKLVEFLLSVPDHLKRGGNKDKILLRNYAAKTFPKLSSAPGRAFYVPLEKYIYTSPLKEVVEQCLSEESVKRRGLFEWGGVRHILEQMRSGDFIFAKQAFALLVLELWFRIYVDYENG